MNQLSYWRSKTAPKVDFIEAVVEEAPAEPDGRVSTETIEVVVGDIFLRLPDRPGRVAEILALLARQPS